MSFGPEEVYDVAHRYLGPDDLLRLATRVNQLISLASKPRRDGESREVTSYRARIAEARVQNNHPIFLAKMNVKVEGGVDPRVQTTLELHADGTKTSLIAARVGRSPDWVRKTLRAASNAEDRSEGLRAA